MNLTANNKLIGLTGNIACGKSTVGKMLSELGAPVIDADQISREVTAPGTPGLQTIVQTLGKEYLSADGKLDRKKVRTAVFSDPKKRKLLESILHPLITAESLDRAMNFFEKGQKTVIYEAPLLVEAGRDKDLFGLICVVCRPEIQLKRLTERDMISVEDAQKIIGAQMPQNEKAKKAKWVIENSGSLDDLRKQVGALWEELRK